MIYQEELLLAPIMGANILLWIVCVGLSVPFKNKGILIHLWYTATYSLTH